MISFRHWIPLGFFLVISLVLWKGLDQDPHQLKSALIGRGLPAFSAPELGSKKIITEKEWRGKIVVLNVFASWCLSCQVEHPVLMDASKESMALWVGLDYMDDKASAQNFLKQRGSPYQVILQDPEGKLGINLGVYGVPETFVIDQFGMIRYRHTGPLTKLVWDQELKPLLNELRKLA